ncbi:hypothetical protein BGZ63DRAFT_44832 [Mariannaea sp. PMI_226]|nr:hypothetical protein BGZ63DRAFT_44832 [Mariannaea sp. PMI_226]
MPSLRGIEISIVTHPGSEKLPQFPHLDASSISIPSPSLNQSGTSDPDSLDQDVTSSKLQRVSPRVSVYIPSSPGSRFGVNYSIGEFPEPSCYLYFKLFLNGRNVTNWGTNIAPQTTGSVTRALFEPDERWHYKENGVVHKREGIEARCFYFLPGSSATSVADEGGLIEVEVFRSKGRKRRTPMLEFYRSQECYSIASPSGGLLESPGEAHYHHWLLVDPRECPFISFRFHYCSWNNLQQLNLIPAEATFESYQPDTPSPLSFRSQVYSSHSLEVHGRIGSDGAATKLLDMLENPDPADQWWSNSRIPGTLKRLSAYRPLPKTPEMETPAPKKLSESCVSLVAPFSLTHIEEEDKDEAELGPTTRMLAQPNSVPGGVVQTLISLRNQVESHANMRLSPSLDPWPLKHINPQQAAVWPLARDSPSNSEVTKSQERKNHEEGVSSQTSQPHINCASLTTPKASMGEGEWLGSESHKSERLVTKVTELMVESVKRTGFYLSRGVNGCFWRKPKSNIFRYLARRGVERRRSQAQ